MVGPVCIPASAAPHRSCGALADMSTRSHRVSPSVISGVLIALSVTWFVSAWVFYLTNRQSKDGVFGAPVWVLLLLVLVPGSTFLLVPSLFSARRSEGQHLRRIDYCALGAGIAPFAFLAALFLVFLATR